MEIKDITYEELKSLYIEQRLSTKKIADIYNCSAITINRKLRQLGIKVRQKSSGRELDLTGCKLGKVTPLYNTGKIDKSRNCYIWLCECQCDENTKTIVQLNTTYLRRGKPEFKNCGCMQAKGKTHRLWNGYKDISGRFISRWKNSAIRKDIKISIDIKYVWDLYEKQDKQCALSGIPLVFTPDEECNASIDRIDSNEGYIDTNIQIVHKTLNQMKNDFSNKLFCYYCDLIYSPLKYEENYTSPKKRGGWKGYGDVPLQYHKQCRDNALARDLEFTITIEDIWEQYKKQNYICALTGLPIQFYPYKISNASVDRIDNNKGYTVDNIQILHKDINWMKWAHTQNNFIDWCNLVAKYQLLLKNRNL